MFSEHGRKTRRVAWHSVADLIFDDRDEREMARHGVTWDEVEQLKGNRRAFADNPRGEPGSVLPIGETNGGRLLTVALAPTHRREDDSLVAAARDAIHEHLAAHVQDAQPRRRAS